MARMITPGVPDDPAVLAGIAKVAIHHGHLDYALRLMVKSLAGVTLKVALDATERQTTGPLMDQVRALARRRLGECSELVKVRALLTRAKKLTNRRNQLMHGLWAIKDVGGPPTFQPAGGRLGRIPRAKDLELLADDMFTLSNEMHWERRHGFLAEALDAKKKLADTTGASD